MNEEAELGAETTPVPSRADADPETTPVPSRADADLLGLRSIQFRTWLSFVMLTAITLIVLWGAQIVFYNATFREMSKSELAHAGDELTDGFTSPDFMRLLHASAVANSCTAFVIDTERDSVVSYADANGSTDPSGIDDVLLGAVMREGGEFVRRMERESDSFVYTETVQDRGNFLIYGSRLSGGGQWLCMVKPYLKNSTAVKVLRNQLVFVTVICMCISMLLALTFSRKIAKPITKFSATAMKLGGGDFDVKFEGNGWTEIDELADTLNYATEEMGKTETLRRDFFANVSHDLRTPLTMVRAYAEMIRDLSGKDPEKRAAHAQIIMDEADKLTLLVEDILDLSKLQAGTNERKIERTDIGSLVRIVGARFEEAMGREGYVIESDVSCTSDVMCDRPRIEQVLYNLIGNAVNYTGADKKVFIRAFETALCVRVEIRDTGKGIAKDELSTVWERYYRSSRTKRAAKGTGLGLSIVKNILSQHDARFGVESVVEGEGESHGTTFWFELKKCDFRQTALPAPKKGRKESGA